MKQNYQVFAGNMMCGELIVETGQDYCVHLFKPVCQRAVFRGAIAMKKIKTYCNLNLVRIPSLEEFNDELFCWD